VQPSNDQPAATTSPREQFEATHDPQDYLRWLNAYTNDGRRGDDELHAFCSWAHSTVAELQNEVGRLREALTYYAEGRYPDSGEMAREALSRV
jgi:hypothetical protein